MKRLLIAVALVVGVALGVTACLRWGDTGAGEVVLGGYFEAEQIQVGSKLAGRVVRVLVEEGRELQAGQEVVSFETDEVEAQLAEARADREAAKARLALLRAGTREEQVRQAAARVGRMTEKLAMLQAGPRPQEIEQARLLFERSKAEYGNARANFERQLALAERNATAAESLDAARKNLDVAQRLMEADQQRYDLLKAGNRAEEVKMAALELAESQAVLDEARKGPLSQEIDQARAAVDAAEARIRRLDVLLGEAVVRAPMPCVVEAIDLQPGDMVVPGAPLATLVRKDQLWVRAFVPETELGFIRDNQKVQVQVDSFPDERFEGTVLRINRLGEFTPRNVQTFRERQDMLFGIKVRVQDAKGVLRPGMAATVYVKR